MRDKVYRGLLFAFALSAGVQLGATAGPRLEETSRSAPITLGKRLIIRHELGSVRVRPTDQEEVRVQVQTALEGTKGAIASYLQGLSTTLQAPPDRDTVEFTVKRPAGEFPGLNQRTVNLDVTCLAGVPVDVTSGWGDLDVKGVAGLKATIPFGAMNVEEVAGDVTLEGRHDKITIAGAEGDVQVTHSFGEVEVSRIGGSLTARNLYGQIRAQGIGRKAVLENKDGPINLTNAIGGAEITCESGQIDATRIQGGLTIRNREESIIAADVQGPVEVTNRNGSTTLSQVVGKLKVTQNSGPVRVKGVRGSAEISNDRGLIEVDGVAGDLTVRNKYSRTTLRDVAGSLDATSAMGPVDVTLSPAQAAKDARPWRLQTDHGNVVIQVPPGAGCSLRVTVRSGKIDSQFPLKRHRDGAAESAEAVINGGGAKVEVTVDLGMVQIVKVPAARPAGAGGAGGAR